MAKRKSRKRAAQARRRQARRKVAQLMNDGTKLVVEHPTTKGYDVQMIQDFLDHLLIELRVQLWENVVTLRKLDETGDLSVALQAQKEPIEGIDEQLVHYVAKYETALIYASAFDFDGVPDELIPVITKKFMSSRIKQRDEQLGHLEALSDLFDEALQCAKLPFGKTEDGKLIQPMLKIKATDFLEFADEGVDFSDDVESRDAA